MNAPEKIQSSQEMVERIGGFGHSNGSATILASLWIEMSLRSRAKLSFQFFKDKVKARY